MTEYRNFLYTMDGVKRQERNFRKYSGAWSDSQVISVLPSRRIEAGILMLEAAKPGYKKSLREIIDWEIAWNKELVEIYRNQEAGIR